MEPVPASARPAVEPAPRATRERPVELGLSLLVTDREVIDALEAIDDPEARIDFALSALRIGVQALQQAHGEIDAERVRREGERLLGELARALQDHARTLTGELGGALREYLDPAGGKFAQRVTRLVAEDGELAAVMRSHVAGDSSEIARTLVRHVGDQSPLLRRLDPKHADGLLQQIHAQMVEALEHQRTRVLEQFSLDREDSALSRLVRQMSDGHGRLRQDLATDWNRVVGQFSLDDEGSALSRLVRQVDGAHRGIVEQFSLDHEGSALSRLRHELTAGIENLTASQRRFQQEVLQNLAELGARRRAEAQTTTHGVLFERRLGVILEAQVASTGDMLHACGASPGRVRNCKVGDFVIEIGPEGPAPGARIVFEAKDAQRFDDAHALAELRTARRNREAVVGVFVFSSTSAGERQRFRRIGDDLLVVWDPEDAGTDVYVQAAVSVARALAFRQKLPVVDAGLDLDAMDKALLEIEQLAGKIDTIVRSGETIRAGADRILDETRKMRDTLARQSVRLRDHLQAVRSALADESPQDPE